MNNINYISECLRIYRANALVAKYVNVKCYNAESNYFGGLRRYELYYSYFC